MIVTVIILKIIKKKVDMKGDQTVTNFKALMKTKEFENFLLTPQGKKLMQTSEFKKLGKDYLLQQFANVL
jgi:hypothetical protein